LLLKGVIDDQSNQDFSVNVMLNKPIIGAGAPAHTYLPEVAARMHSELIVPTHAEVANAIGAISGSIFETVEITIQPKPGWAFIEDPPCVLFAPDGQREYDTFKDALAYGELHGEELARAAAERECAVDVLVTMERNDREGTVGSERGGKIFLESKLVFTANGKPGIAV
jgi:N-methylhydantoinase A/oxoprolinase/acetone carboxylase beta subunit